MNSDSIEKILCAYPNLNPTWLLTGRGEMLNITIEEDKNANLDANLNANLSPQKTKSKDKNDRNNLLEDKVGAKGVDENIYSSSQFDDNQPSLNIVAESPMYETYGKEKPKEQYSGANEIIMNLVDRLNEQAEEIGALRHENATLKYQLAQLAEDVGNAQDVPA